MGRQILMIRAPRTFSMSSGIQMLMHTNEFSTNRVTEGTSLICHSQQGTMVWWGGQPDSQGTCSPSPEIRAAPDELAEGEDTKAVRKRDSSQISCLMRPLRREESVREQPRFSVAFIGLKMVMNPSPEPSLYLSMCI